MTPPSMLLTIIERMNRNESFILSLAHLVGASLLVVCMCKILFDMRKTVKLSYSLGNDNVFQLLGLRPPDPSFLQF